MLKKVPGTFLKKRAALVIQIHRVVDSCKYSEKQRSSFLNFQYQATGIVLLCVGSDDANIILQMGSTKVEMPYLSVCKKKRDPVVNCKASSCNIHSFIKLCSS